MILDKQNQVKPLPYPIYFWTVFLIGLTGLGVSMYLAISHYRVYTDIAYSSFCAISKAINCDTVSQSVYSIFLEVPIPVWGVLGYLFFLLLQLLAMSEDACKKRIWSLLFFLALAYSLYSVVLALISTFYIHSYCLMCIVSYAVNFMLLYYVWIIRKRFPGENLILGVWQDIGFLGKKKKQSLFLLLPVLVVMICLPFVFPAYWQLKTPQPAVDVPTGVTPEGHPWIGAVNPALTIIEYTDYQCFQCKKMHRFLRHIVNTHFDKIRLVHRHFPMDHQVNPLVKEPFHVGSGALALVAIYAAVQDKFWPVNDYLFDVARQTSQIDLRELSNKFALNAPEMAAALKHRNTRNALIKDINEGLKLGITGTPGYVINGELHLAQIPPEILKKYIQ